MKTFVYVGNAKRGGVSIFELNREGGTLDPRGTVMAEVGAAPLAISPDRRFLYASIHSDPPSTAAFAIDSETGALHHLNTVPVPASLTYLCVDATAGFLLGASYGGDLLCILALGREGMVQREPACLVRPGRNPHCIVLDRSNRYAYVPLLGSDQVAVYRFHAGSGKLETSHPPFASTDREAGPRHLILSPDGRFAHVLTELSGEILTYAVHGKQGYLTPTHSVPLLPPERALPPGRYEPPVNLSGGANSPSPVIWAADIRMTPDGRFLYASERTGSTLSHFRVDPVSGRLDRVGVTETETQPRGFAIEPFGRHLIVAGEKSNRISVYGIDGENGALTPADRREVGAGPNWIECVAFL